VSAARRAVVIGGGVAGCTVALELARAEVQATLIEPRAAIGGATGAAAGILAPQFETDPGDPLFPLLLASRRAYPDFVHAVERASGRDLDFREDGLVIANLGAAETEAAARAAERYRAHGLTGVVRDAEGGEWLVPGLGPVDSVLWLPDEAAIDAQALAPALERALATAGVEVRRDRAIGLETRAGAVRGVALETGGILACDLVFLAAGAWSDDVLDPHRKARVVRPVRGQMLRFRGLVPALPRQVADHAGCYALPRADGSVVVGSTMEEAGYEERTTGGGLEAIRSRAFGWLPGLRDAILVETWAGLRPFTPDGLPVLGADPEVDGLHHATGYGRNGILIAPQAAALAVAAALRARPGAALLESLSPFDPARLA